LHLFDATKKQLYSQDQAFVEPDLLGFKELPERKVIRKANLATFISSVFGSVDVGFFHLNEGFLNTFAPDGSRLLKDSAKLLLDLKTQVSPVVFMTEILGIYLCHGPTLPGSKLDFERLVSLSTTNDLPLRRSSSPATHPDRPDPQRLDPCRN
jgi:hypothetical protein